MSHVHDCPSDGCNGYWECSVENCNEDGASKCHECLRADIARLNDKLSRIELERESFAQEYQRMRDVIKSLKSALQWYVENDNTQEGGTWEVYCATELRHKRKAIKLLEDV